jgi:hypothetical protein
MKFMNKLFGMAMIALMLMSCAPTNMLAQGDYQDSQYISDQEFYDELSPYGTWVDDPKYGTVWVPDVDGDFRPYATNGHWVLTDYDWGWAAFHYGRWNFDDYYGWEWIPGNEWSPAWVTWRSGGGYYGWAPLGPDVSYETAYSDNYYVPDNYWVFASQAYINSPDVYNYYLPYSGVPNILRRTTYIRNRNTFNNRSYYTGPRRDEIQRFTNRPVSVYNIRNVNRPSAIRVNNNTVNIYRPSIRNSGSARPARVVDGTAYRQQFPNQRIGGNDRRNGTIYNRANAAQLANTARNTNPDNRMVRVYNPNRPGTTNPAVNNNPGRPNNNTDRGRRPNVNQSPEQQQQRQQAWEQQRQQREQQRQQQNTQQQQGFNQQALQQQQQLREQQRLQQQQAREQARQQRQQMQQGTDPQQNQQQQQIREQQRQQMQQAREQQRQQREQQRQQMGTQGQQDQQRQQQEQQRQQQQQALQQQRDQQRQQMEQQRQQQAQQQAEQQRQQQQQAMQQQREQQRQQQDQQRQQQEQQRQQAEQQRQQQQQAQQQQREQQRQQQDQQRQQQEQQRQQAEQQRRQQEQQQQPPRESGRQRPGRP